MITLTLTPLVTAAAFAAFAAQPDTCPVPPKPATIHVALDVTQPRIDHTVAQAALKRFDVATISPYGNGKDVHVNGLMRGAITLETQSALALQSTEDGSSNCSWYDTIDIRLVLKPVIYIARELLEGSCMYREVLNHEYRHFKMDYDVLNAYKLVFEDELTRFVQQTGVMGPYSRERMIPVQKDMTARLERTVRAINDRLKSERIKYQRQIDSKQEYDRVAFACSGTAGAR